MEADWEIEIGPGAPIMDASWAGFVDLRRDPSLARQMPEADLLPSLAEALAKLNSRRTSIGLWTAKCDVWQLATEEIDPYELDAAPDEAAFAWACYIDLLPVSDQQWGHIWDPESNTPTAAVAWCKCLCKRLYADPLGRCRIDLIIRRAAIDWETTDIGITVYITGCGATSQDAKSHVSKALMRFVDGFEPRAKVE